MKSDLVITIALFCVMIGIGIGMYWRHFQVDAVYRDRIVYLEEERRNLKIENYDLRAQIGLMQGRGKKK